MRPATSLSSGSTTAYGGTSFESGLVQKGERLGFAGLDGGWYCGFLAISGEHWRTSIA